jgi:hypothetical protein
MGSFRNLMHAMVAWLVLVDPTLLSATAQPVTDLS